MAHAPIHPGYPDGLLSMSLTRLLVTVALAFASGPVFANPQGARVVAGSVAIAHPAPDHLAVSQASEKAIIDWRSFSVRAGEQTTFAQPNARAITLNRVVGGDASKIMGALKANGQVWLINPNGIMFGKTARVDVAGLLATTLDINNSDFMAGHYHFHASTHSAATVINAGRITVNDAGLAALVAPGVGNSGVIEARLGEIQLASVSGFTVDLYGDGTFNFLLDKQATQAIQRRNSTPLAVAVSNSGTLIADGGTILLTAAAAKSVVDHTIDMSGYARARSANTKGGIIILNGGNSGTVQVSGTLDASGKRVGQKGGTVRITGDKIGLLNGANVDVSGNQGGGQTTVGGGRLGGKASSATLVLPGITQESRPVRVTTFISMEHGVVINADALMQGNGGKVVLRADAATSVHGSISAKGGIESGNGGLIETSGKQSLDIAGARIDSSATKGNAGNWLLDPANLLIDGPAAKAIDAALNSGTNSSISVAGGEVDITHDITKSAGGDATFLINANFIHQYPGTSVTSSSGKLNVDYEATDRVWIGRGWLGATANFVTNGGNITFHGPDFVGVNGNINAGSGNILIKAENSDPTGVDKGIWIYRNSVLTGNSIVTIQKSTIRVDPGVIRKLTRIQSQIFGGGSAIQNLSTDPSLNIAGSTPSTSAHMNSSVQSFLQKQKSSPAKRVKAIVSPKLIRPYYFSSHYEMPQLKQAHLKKKDVSAIYGPQKRKGAKRSFDPNTVDPYDPIKTTLEDETCLAVDYLMIARKLTKKPKLTLSEGFRKDSKANDKYGKVNGKTYYKSDFWNYLHGALPPPGVMSVTAVKDLKTAVKDKKYSLKSVIKKDLGSEKYTIIVGKVPTPLTRSKKEWHYMLITGISTNQKYAFANDPWTGRSVKISLQGPKKNQVVGIFDKGKYVNILSNRLKTDLPHTIGALISSQNKAYKVTNYRSVTPKLNPTLN